MINIFIYSLNKNIFKLISIYLKREYKENIDTLSLPIETNEFQKLINLFNPQKITYENIIFYTKSSEKFKEMVSSDFNILIFNSKQQMEEETTRIRERDIEIIENYLNSKAIQKNPDLKHKIEQIITYINKFPNLKSSESIQINSQYEEIITLLSLISIKKNLIIVDEEIIDENETIVLYYPISLLVEINDLEENDAKTFLSSLNLSTNFEEEVKKIVKKIVDRILSHWTIFYTGNKKEVKEYLVLINTDVLKASSKIHTDIAKKFIQAEVCNIAEMVDNKLPSFKTFGKTYIVQNHDYLSIKTS